MRPIAFLALMTACGPTPVPAFPHPVTGACPGATATFADTSAIATDLDPKDPAAATRTLRVFPRIPPELFNSRQVGHVVVSFILDSLGRVDPSSSVILRASDPRYAASVCETLPQMELPPRTRRGQPVTARVREEFTFVPANAPRPSGPARPLHN